MKTSVAGLVAARNKTVMLPANSDRALNKFLTEHDWNEEQFNRESQFGLL